ncbi:MAG: AbrB/MazE/SpoVT family DNA-binding domain-containing protein [Panacagrimonas sp.]
MRLTSKGHITIPQVLRERYGLLPDTEVSFEVASDGVRIRPAGAERMKRLRAAIAKSRGSATAGLGTDAIMRLARGED